MMVTGEVVDYIDKELRGKILPLQFKYRAPDNQKGEYIVINPLVSVGNQEQNTTLNINVYVDNLTLSINGKTDNSQPNHVRLTQLQKQLVALVNDNWKQSGLITVTSQDTFYESGVTFFNLQINFKNFNFKY